MNTIYNQRYFEHKRDKMANKYSSKKSTKMMKRWKLKHLESKKKVSKKVKPFPIKYKVYIKSQLWKVRRDSYFEKYPKVCSVCFTTKNIHLHHKLYENYGKEEDYTLVPLCKKHHEKFHTEFGVTKRNMILATEEFIRNERRRVR